MAAAAAAAVFDGSITPPPPTCIRTPPTPRLGYQDNWEPYPARKSARISSQRNDNRTPSPNGAHRKQPRSPRTVKKTNKHPSSITPPMPSPQKKRQPALDSVRRASGVMSVEGSHAAAALGIDDVTTQRPVNSTITRGGMLPTPSKTPQKPPNVKTAASIKSIARNLFTSEVEEAMPSPKKKRAKKYSGFSMDSFTAEEVEDPIEIFTDSQDRIPSRDQSDANPFYGDAAPVAEPTKRRSKRRQVNVPGEGVQSVDEASRREDGMVYVFRGKKFFRRFSENDDDDDETQGTEMDAEAYLARPLTRSAIKPRLLFQPEKTEAMLEEEEAATDIEEQEEEEAVPSDPQTPSKPHQKRANTPDAPQYAPVSPPDTRRTTRSANRLLDEPTPVKPSGRKSPFDSWRRTKEPRATAATKRSGDNLTPTHAKRTRS